MSRTNPLAAALIALAKSEITHTQFLGVWNNREIAQSYRGEGISYESNSRERLLKIGIHGGMTTSFSMHIGTPALAPPTVDKLMAVAVYATYAQEGWDFVPAYLKNNVWNPITLWAWTGYVMVKELDFRAQRKFLEDYPHLDMASRVKCVLTGALIPKELSVVDYVNQAQERVFQRGRIVSYLHQIHPWEIKWKYYQGTPYYSGGYYPIGIPEFTVRWDIDGLMDLPDTPTTRTLFKHHCPECDRHVIPQKWKRDICVWCLGAKYPNVDIKSYSENALKFVNVQVSLKKPFIMPQHPIKWLTPILLGCELEYNCEDAHSLDVRLSLLKYLDKFVIFKHDGSLHSSGGFEIVTAPADLPLHKEKFIPVFNEFPAELVVDSSTGMHIHLDRNALSPLMLGRMTEFMHNPNNKDFIQAVGERAFNTYSTQLGLGYRNVLDSSNGGSRYGTLNLCPQKTVEFRIFKSPKTFPSFIKNLEFVVSLVQYFRTGGTSVIPKEGKKYEVFLDYLKKENRSKLEARNTSHHLTMYLKEKGIL